MAHVKFSGLVANISGKLGGHVFQRSRSGSIIKNLDNSAGVTALQEQRQSLLNFFVTQWNSLTQEQRNLWIAWAQMYPQRSRRAGGSILTAREVYVRRQIVSFLALGVTNFTNPAEPPGRIVIGGSELVKSGNNLVVINDFIETEGQWAVYIEMTKPLRPEQVYKYSRTKVIAGSSIPYPNGELEISAQYRAAWGIDLELGQQVAWQFVVRQASSGTVRKSGLRLITVVD